MSKSIDEVRGHPIVKSSTVINRIQEIILVRVQELQFYTAERILSALSPGFALLLLGIAFGLSCHVAKLRSVEGRTQRLQPTLRRIPPTR